MAAGGSVAAAFFDEVTNLQAVKAEVLAALNDQVDGGLYGGLVSVLDWGASFLLQRCLNEGCDLNAARFEGGGGLIGGC